MYRATVRTVSKQAASGLRSQALRSAPRRFASTAAPADRPRSWKSSALRWGLAISAVYYYNTSSVFAEEAIAPGPIAAPSSFAESDLPTVESVVEQKRQQLKSKSDEQQKSSNKSDKPTKTEPQPSTESQTTAAAGSPAALEEEADQQGAFNPETGEINWDCPCLGGMADGPCGEEFKTAFSCFVYSNEEPKGMDCIDKFQGMQECFRKYPDIYGAELADDVETPGSEEHGSDEYQVPREESASNITKADAKPAADSGIPKSWEDATDADKKDAEKEQPAEKAEDEKKE